MSAPKVAEPPVWASAPGAETPRKALEAWREAPGLKVAVAPAPLTVRLLEGEMIWPVMARVPALTLVGPV